MSRSLNAAFRRPALMVCALVLGLGTALGAAAQIPDAVVPVHPVRAPGAGTLLSVSAQGEASRVPDVARLSTGVVTQAADANAAMRANAEQMNAVVAAVRKAGIAERDVQTGAVDLHPQYRHSENQPPVITGYQASNSVNITVRDISRLGAILDALVAAGANQINGPSFEIDDEQPAYDEARRAALETARGRAEMYAKALGMQVRRIVSISEGGSVGPPMPIMVTARMEKSSDTSISPGENTLSVNLDVVFELER